MGHTYKLKESILMLTAAAVGLKLEPNYERPLDQPGDQLAQSFCHPVVLKPLSQTAEPTTVVG